MRDADGYEAGAGAVCGESGHLRGAGESDRAGDNEEVPEGALVPVRGPPGHKSANGVDVEFGGHVMALLGKAGMRGVGGTSRWEGEPQRHVRSRGIVPKRVV